jgi:hypothetical protein
VRTLADSVSFEFKFTPGASSLTNMLCRLSKRIEESPFTERHFPYSEFRVKLSRFERYAKALLNDTLVNSLILLVLRPKLIISVVLQKTTVPCVDDLTFEPENSRRATERPCSTKSTSNPLAENSTRAKERSSSSELREDWKTARESFSDLGGALLYWRKVLV